MRLGSWIFTGVLFAGLAGCGGSGTEGTGSGGSSSHPQAQDSCERIRERLGIQAEFSAKELAFLFVTELAGVDESAREKCVQDLDREFALDCESICRVTKRT